MMGRAGAFCLPHQKIHQIKKQHKHLLQDVYTNTVIMRRVTEPTELHNTKIIYNNNIIDNNNNNNNKNNNNNSAATELNESCKIGMLAASTIMRAKSASCKQQIVSVACSIVKDTLFPKKLPRFCPIKGIVLYLLLQYS